MRTTTNEKMWLNLPESCRRFLLWNIQNFDGCIMIDKKLDALPMANFDLEFIPSGENPISELILSFGKSHCYSLILSCILIVLGKLKMHRDKLNLKYISRSVYDIS